jgi:hypothetical protein
MPWCQRVHARISFIIIVLPIYPMKLPHQWSRCDAMRVSSVRPNSQWDAE